MTNAFTTVLLALLFAGAAGRSSAQTPLPPPVQDIVRSLAQDVAKKAYAPPLEVNWKSELDYDQFRQIRVRKERTVWRNEGLGFELQLLPVGWLFKAPVEINVVESGNVRTLEPDNTYFDIGPLAGKLPPETRIAFSGFRITGPINRPDILDEIIVFQGASYFRALSRGQTYGLSARGLALNVGRPEGEEFPAFRRFWIEKPEAGAPFIVIHALLDSPSLAGAYRFQVSPGAPTTIDVEATLYPRKDLPFVGIAPLTSMFLFSGLNRARVDDFRTAVHDSDGLAIVNGVGEQLWRPLNNPRRLQTSSFVDQSPRGFGLIQRARTFAAYQDLEAHYERRPSSWVAPVGDWGLGAVELFEIPTEEEIHDNIVAYWKPAQPLPGGKTHEFKYRLSWPDEAPRPRSGAYVHASRSGLTIGPQRKAGVVQFAVDFRGLPPLGSTDLPLAKIEASAGMVAPPVVEPNPHIDGLRTSFTFDPKGAASAELRLVLQAGDRAISDTWLYRWTRD